MYRQALAIGESIYGCTHPDVATFQTNLAVLLQRNDQFPEAELLMRQALAIDEGSKGLDHPDVARDLVNLAGLLRQTERLKLFGLAVHALAWPVYATGFFTVLI